MPVQTALRRALGVGFGLAIIVGNTVGAGILRAPGVVAARLPSATLMFAVWLLGGVYSLLAANALAELGTMLPRSGGQYVYARHAFGPYPGFVVGWSDWLAQCGGSAALALVVADAVAFVVPPLVPYRVMLAVTIVVGLVALLWRGVVWTDRVQSGTSVLKGVMLLVLVAACLLAGRRFAGTGDHLPLVAYRHWLAGALVALQAVIFTYNGWDGVLFFAEEVRDPERSIPRTLFAGVGLVGVLYLLVNAALILVLTPQGMARADVAAAAAMRAIAGAQGDTAVHVIIATTLVSSVTANLLLASRVSFALARDGSLPQVGTSVNAGGTPTVALGISAAVAIAFLLSGTFELVIAVLAIFFVLEFTLSIIALFVLRRREPDRPRPWRAWGHPWTTGVVLAGSIAFLAAAIVGDPWHSAIAGAAVAFSYPVYRLRDVGRRGSREESVS